MKIRSLELQAFGHFSGRRLSFARPGYGFELIYGPNEAGKSTALRAVRGLLFGIPQGSVDTFMHEGKHLRLRGEVATVGGLEERLCFTRRKGRKNTLLGDAGEPISESELSRFLGGADQGLFNAMFGLDHESLREGAQALLSGEGKVGESLFGASVGTASIRALLLEFRGQAEQLFTAKGRSGKRITQGISDVRAARQKIHQSATTASGYLTEQGKLEGVNTEVEGVRQLRAVGRAKKERLERQLRILPLLARRDNLASQIAALGELPELPADIRERRERAVSQLEENRQKAEFEGAEVARLEERLSGLRVSDVLISLDEALIGDLSQRLGQYRKARLDLPKRAGELAQKQEEARELLRSLGHDPDLTAALKLRLTRPEELQLRDLNKERTRYEATLQVSAGKLKEAQRRATFRKKELSQNPEARSVRALARVIKRAHALVGLPEQAAQMHQRARGETPELERAYAELGSLTANLEELLRLQPPPMAQIRSLASRSEAAAAAQAEAESQESEQLGRQVVLRQKIAEMQALSSVPSVDGLSASRAAREECANEHAEALEQLEARCSEAAARHAKETWNSFRDLAERAEDYSDRLRADSARAAKLAVAQAELRAAGESVELARDLAARQRQIQAALVAEHQSLWDGRLSHSLGPPDMLSWLQARASVVALAEQRKAARADAKQLEFRVAAAMDELSAELVQLGEPGRMMWESLAQLIERAESVLSDVTTLAHARRGIEQHIAIETTQLEEQESALAELKETAKSWRVRWQKALKDLGLPKDAGTEEVSAMLDGLGDLFHRLEEIRGLERRIEGMQRDGEQLRLEVEKHLSHALPEGLSLPLEEGTELLIQQFRRSTEADKERRRLIEELSARKANVERWEFGAAKADKTLEELLLMSGADSVPELQKLEIKVLSAQQLRGQLADNEADLLGQGDGFSLQAMTEEVQATSAERNRQLLAELEPELEEAERKLETLLNQRATLEQKLVQLQGGAASAAEELAAKTAALRSDVNQYVRLKLADQILTQEIERYRAQHQGPVLSAASEMFPQLTLGNYTGLSVGFDKKDEQVLQCVRSDGREVPVLGLSDGTRDQLYLSLRLATLERYLADNPPLPLVLDDILVHFDDERAKAALSVLGELSRKTQVLFFTHHQRLVELARVAVPAEQLNVQPLTDPAPPAEPDEFSSLAG